MCILTSENYAFVHSTDQKNRLHASDFTYSSLHFKKSGAIGVQHPSSPLLSPSAPFYTHQQINVVIKKKRRGVQGGAPDQACPPPGRGVRGAVPPALRIRPTDILTLVCSKPISKL